MRRLSPTPARAGMTLIELLVVMMIIATLASLVLSAVFTVRDAQTKNFTEATIQKLASAWTQHLQAEIDQIREEAVPGWALAMGNGDQRVARVIYLKARLKQAFPVSFYQAIYPGANFRPLQTATYQTLTANDLPPKPTFVKALGPLAPSAVLPPPNTNQPIPPLQVDAATQLDWESSALAYLWLSQGRRGLTGFNPDEAVGATAVQTRTVTAGNATVQLKIFVDAWGYPLHFWTFPYGNDELNGQPYRNAFSQNQQSPDPQDPEQAFLMFDSPTWNPRFTAMVHPPFYIIPGTQPPKRDLRTLTPVVGSAGKDGALGVDPFDMSVPATAGAAPNDNIYSYRLRRSGQRGD